MLSLRPALPSAPSLRVLAMLAAAGGIGLWGATLFAPRPAAMPPALAPPRHARLTMARWRYGSARMRRCARRSACWA